MTLIKTITFLFLKKHIAINRYVIVDLHNIFFDNEAAVSDFSIKYHMQFIWFECFLKLCMITD